MISCNHFAITTTYLHGYLQIYCKNAFFTEKYTPTQIAEKTQLVEQKPCQGALSPAFCVRYIQRKKSQKTLRLSFLERKTRVCPSALHSVYQALTFAQYYTPNSRDTWEGSGCRFRVRLFPYKLQNYSCLRQIYE